MHLWGYIFQKLLLAWNFSCINKKCFLSRRRILLATLLYEQFIHLTLITLRPNIQLLSNRQHAYQSLELLPGLILFTLLWHAGWTLKKKTVVWTWTTIIRLQYLEVFLPKMYKFLVDKYIRTIRGYIFQKLLLALTWSMSPLPFIIKQIYDTHPLGREFFRNFT